MKRGSIVQQIVKPIEGVVTSFQIDQQTGDKLIEVTWTDETGVVNSRFFSENDLKVLPSE